ncbi:MAG: DNA-processing protein DprA [Burkholderiaceae bacterium]
MQRDELAAWLRLTLTDGVGNLSARKLLAAFGLPHAIFEQSPTALQHIVSQAQARALKTQPEGWEALIQATQDWLAGVERDGVARRIVSLADPLYPRSLLAIDDPPLLLYVTGAIDIYAHIAAKEIANDIAIVGSRNPTPQGEANARNFAKSFALSGLHVVSGLALGVDGAAHLGALDAHQESAGSAGSTIAVVGTGLDRVYPKKHYELAHRIAMQGVLLSEFPIGTPPIAANFPKRNRIISALTQGTLVVEAAIQSGSLITARMALEQGKDVFAIPGSIHSTVSKGCHLLIKQGAKLVESAQDVLEELQHPVAAYSVAFPANSKAPAEPFDSANTTSATDTTTPNHALLEALGHDPVSLDALIARTGIDAATLQARLFELELSNQVARLPGGLFQRQALA